MGLWGLVLDCAERQSGLRMQDLRGLQAGREADYFQDRETIACPQFPLKGVRPHLPPPPSALLPAANTRVQITCGPALWLAGSGQCPEICGSTL